MSEGFRLVTGRLVLRRFQESDLGAFLAYRNDPEVARYQSWTSCSREEAEAILAGHEAPGTPGEWTQIALERRGRPPGARRHAPRGALVENIWFKGAWGSEFLYAILEREWRGRA